MAEVVEEFQLRQVLQRRHLYQKPIELLVKVKCEDGRTKDIWMTQSKLRGLEGGKFLIRKFNKTKVGERGVDVYIGKRRSLTMKPSVNDGNKQADRKTIDQQHNAEDATGNVVEISKTSSSNGDDNSLINNHSVSTVNNTKLVKKAKKIKEDDDNVRYNLNFDKFSSLKHKRTKSLDNVKLYKRTCISSNVDALSLNLCEKTSSESSGSSQKKTKIASDVTSESSVEEVLYSLPDDSSSAVINGSKKLPSSGEAEKKRKSKSDSSQTKKRLKIDSKQESNSKSEQTSASKKISGLGKPLVTMHPLSCGSTCTYTSGAYSAKTNCAPERPVCRTFDLSKSVPCPASMFCEYMSKTQKKDCNNDADGDVSNERRISIRQTESVFKFKEIVVRKFSGFVHLMLAQTSSKHMFKNSFNPKVFHELNLALRNAVHDDSRVVLLSAAGSIFSSGIDLQYLLNSEEDRRTAARVMAESLREFINILITFPKPIIVAVNGPAVGLGVAILPLCDIIYASDKASFSCSYTTLCQSPEGCSSYTFPRIMGMAMLLLREVFSPVRTLLQIPMDEPDGGCQIKANEMLLRSRKITALEANQIGLITQVFWPDNLMTEVMPRVQDLALQSSKSLECTKALIRNSRRSKLESINAGECRILMDRWASSECQRAMKLYTEKLDSV